MKFRLLPNVGSHAGIGKAGEAEVYEAGDIVESDQDLTEAYPNKFELVKEETPEPSTFKPTKKKQKKTDVQKAAEKGAEDVLPPEEKEEEPNPLGRDVTHRFPLAEEEDFRVFADGGAFSVVEADDLSEVLNETPLKRKGVDPFIREYLET